MPLPDCFFRTLSPDEEEKFRQFARDHFSPGERPKEFDIWHPVVRAEWARLEKEQEK